MTRQCPRCAATLADSAQYCKVCGQSLTQGIAAPSMAVPAPTAGFACPNCRTPIKGTELFCKQCGTPLASRTAPAASAGGLACSNCGNSSNPPGSSYCVRCGNSLGAGGRTETAAPPPRVTPFVPGPQLVCPNCGEPVRSGTRFCVACGASVVPGTTSAPMIREVEGAAPPSEDEEPAEASPPSEFDAEEAAESTLPSERADQVEPIEVPDDVLKSLAARGEQLALEDQYTKSKTASDDLIENLSEAATNGSIALEELIDTYVSERSEQERLEGLHESGEVSDRVYERLTKEYENKLTGIEEKIQEGVATLRGYQAYLREERAKTEEDLETIKAKREVGDEEEEVEERQAELTKQAQRLRWAIAATTHILEKEAALRGEPVSRFEVSETTVSSAAPEEVSKPAAAKPAVVSAPKPPAEMEAGKICPACGRVTPPNTKFCIYCGSRV